MTIDGISPAYFREYALRISIFLSASSTREAAHRGAEISRCALSHGTFLNAMGGNSAEENEQNIVTVEGDGHVVVFKQIAGLIARRIVFIQVGDRVARGIGD